MPTIEFYGYDESAARRLEGILRDRLAGEDFRADCVFVDAADSRVRDWDGGERPFVRVSTRSPERAERFQVLLADVCDLEIVRIHFQPKTGA